MPMKNDDRRDVDVDETRGAAAAREQLLGSRNSYEIEVTSERDCYGYYSHQFLHEERIVFCR